MAKYAFYGKPLTESLKSYSKDKAVLLEAALKDSVDNTESKAISRAPVNDWLGTSIKMQIRQERIGKNQFAVISGHYQSAYWEFGTGVTVFQGETWVDEDIRNYASQFFKTGTGTIRPHPYLFNSYIEEVTMLQEKIKEIFK